MLAFFLVTLSNAIELNLELGVGVHKATEQAVMATTFDKYEPSTHPVKEVALELALQHAKSLPKEIRAMVTKANETLSGAQIRKKARMLRASTKDAEVTAAMVNMATTYGSRLIVDPNDDEHSPDPNNKNPEELAAESPKYKMLDLVRKTLNDLYNQAQSEMDLTYATCSESEMSLKEQLHENTGERVRSASAIAMAREQIAQAHSNIDSATLSLDRWGRDLTHLNQECHVILTDAEAQAKIIRSDLEVAHTVEDMTDCSKMAAANSDTSALLLQMQCFVGIQSSHVAVNGDMGKLMKKFKTKAAFNAFVQVAKTVLAEQSSDQHEHHHRHHDGSSTTTGTTTVPEGEGFSPILPEGNMTHAEWEAAMSLPDDTAWMNDVGIEDLPTSCKALDGRINLGEKCPILADAVGRMVGEIAGMLSVVEKFIQDNTVRCANERQTMEAAIAHFNEELTEAGIALAQATSQLNLEEKTLGDRVVEFHDLATNLRTTMGDCNDKLRQSFEEKCSLITIRNELYKMSGAQPYMQDCEVSDWSPGECSVDCGGGTQTWTRAIDQPQYFGAGCPPLAKVEMCNTDPCPINCVYEMDWSEWGDCSNECGGGLHTMERTIKFQGLFGGEACGDTLKSSGCNTGSCNKDCVLSEWHEWTGCSKMCGGGLKTRTKHLLAKEELDGVCTDLHEEKPIALTTGIGARWEDKACNTLACDINFACNTKMDVVMVLDGSGSVGSDGWWYTVNFAKLLLSKLYLDEDEGAKVGIVLYSTNVELVSKLSTDAAELDAAIDGMKFPKRSTHTGEAIQAALNLVGPDAGRDDAQSIVFVVTDGDPTYYDPTQAASDRAAIEGVRLVFVGVKKPNYKNIDHWATFPPKANVIKVAQYWELEAKLDVFISDLCPVLFCPETFQDADENDYEGCQDETIYGKQCQRWDVQEPQTHNYGPHITNLWGELRYPRLEGNYCRNPSHWSGGLWCYTTDKATLWEPCDPRNVTSLPSRFDDQDALGMVSLPEK